MNFYLKRGAVSVAAASVLASVAFSSYDVYIAANLTNSTNGDSYAVVPYAGDDSELYIVAGNEASASPQVQVVNNGYRTLNLYKKASNLDENVTDFTLDMNISETLASWATSTIQELKITIPSNLTLLDQKTGTPISASSSVGDIYIDNTKGSYLYLDTDGDGDIVGNYNNSILKYNSKYHKLLTESDGTSVSTSSTEKKVGKASYSSGALTLSFYIDFAEGSSSSSSSSSYSDTGSFLINDLNLSTTSGGSGDVDLIISGGTSTYFPTQTITIGSYVDSAALLELNASSVNNVKAGDGYAEFSDFNVTIADNMVDGDGNIRIKMNTSNVSFNDINVSFGAGYGDDGKGKANYDTNISIDDSDILIDWSELKAKVGADMNHTINIKGHLTVGSSVGDGTAVTISFDSDSDGNFTSNLNTSDSLTIATVAKDGVAVSNKTSAYSSKINLANKSFQTGTDFNITEKFDDSFESGDTITLSLPSGYTWDSKPTIERYTYSGSTWSQDTTYNSGVYQSSVNPDTTSNVYTLTLSSTQSDYKTKVYTSSSTRERLRISDLAYSTPSDATADTTVEMAVAGSIEDSSRDVTGTPINIAVIKDSTATVDDTTDITSDDFIQPLAGIVAKNKATFKITETYAGTIQEGTTITLTLPTGHFPKCTEATTPAQSATTAFVVGTPSCTDDTNKTVSWSVSTESTADGKSVTFYLPEMDFAGNDTEQVISATVGGTAGVTGTVTVADLRDALTITSGEVVELTKGDVDTYTGELIFTESLKAGLPAGSQFKLVANESGILFNGTCKVATKTTTATTYSSESSCTTATTSDTFNTNDTLTVTVAGADGTMQDIKYRFGVNVASTATDGVRTFKLMDVSNTGIETTTVNLARIGAVADLSADKTSISLNVTDATDETAVADTETVTMSNALGTLSVACADTTIATANLSGNAVTITAGSTAGTTTCTVTDSGGTDRSVGITVTVADPSVDTDGDGVLDSTDKCAATTSTTVDADGCATEQILIIDPKSLTILTGDTGAITASQNLGTVSAVSSDTSVATVTSSDNTVTVTGVSKGSATITVKDDTTEKTKTAKVTVVTAQDDTDNDGVADINDICPNTTEGSIVDTAGCADNQIIKATNSMVAVLTSTTATNTFYDNVGTVTVTSSNTSVATTTLLGKTITLNPVAIGYSTVTLKDDTTGLSDTFRVEVIANVQDSDNDGIIDAIDECPDVAGDALNNGCEIAGQLTLSDSSLTMVKGDTSSSVSVANITGSAITATIDNDTVATVTASGVDADGKASIAISPLGVGETTITVSDDTSSDIIDVVVTSVAETGMILEPTYLEFVEGGAKQYVSISGATGTVTAVSKNTGKATAKMEGTDAIAVSPAGLGFTKVTVTDSGNGKTKTVLVKVKNATASSKYTENGNKIGLTNDKNNITKKQQALVENSDNASGNATPASNTGKDAFGAYIADKNRNAQVNLDTPIKSSDVIPSGSANGATLSNIYIENSIGTRIYGTYNSADNTIEFKDDSGNVVATAKLTSGSLKRATNSTLGIEFTFTENASSNTMYNLNIDNGTDSVALNYRNRPAPETNVWTIQPEVVEHPDGLGKYYSTETIRISETEPTSLVTGKEISVNIIGKYIGKVSFVADQETFACSHYINGDETTREACTMELEQNVDGDTITGTYTVKATSNNERFVFKIPANTVSDDVTDTFEITPKVLVTKPETRDAIEDMAGMLYTEISGSSILGLDLAEESEVKDASNTHPVLGGFLANEAVLCIGQESNLPADLTELRDNGAISDEQIWVDENEGNLERLIVPVNKETGVGSMSFAFSNYCLGNDAEFVRDAAAVNENGYALYDTGDKGVSEAELEISTASQDTEEYTGASKYFYDANGKKLFKVNFKTQNNRTVVTIFVDENSADISVRKANLVINNPYDEATLPIPFYVDPDSNVSIPDPNNGIDDKDSTDLEIAVGTLDANGDVQTEMPVAVDSDDNDYSTTTIVVKENNDYYGRQALSSDTDLRFVIRDGKFLDKVVFVKGKSTCEHYIAGTKQDTCDVTFSVDSTRKLNDTLVASMPLEISDDSQDTLVIKPKVYVPAGLESGMLELDVLGVPETDETIIVRPMYIVGDSVDLPQIVGGAWNLLGNNSNLALDEDDFSENDIAYNYDADTTTWNKLVNGVASTYDSESGEWVEASGFTVLPREGFWLKSADDKLMTLDNASVSDADGAMSLPASGWAMFGCMAETNTLGNVKDIVNAMSVWSYDGETGTWANSETSAETSMTSGQGMWIKK
jgi:hypothetical protein